MDPQKKEKKVDVSNVLKTMLGKKKSEISKEGKPNLPESDSLDHLSSAEIDKRFESLLEDMNLSADKRAPLLDKPIQYKRKMLANSAFGQSKTTNSPAQYCKSLSNPQQLDEKQLSKPLDSLRIVLLNGRVSWVKEFNNEKNDGLNLLLSLLAHCLSKNYLNGTLQSLRCIRALGNCGYGLYALVDHEMASTFISSCLDVTDVSLMECALELLSTMAMCSLKGHQKVIEGLTFSAELSTDRPARLTPLIEGLKVNELAFPCLQLINVIASARFLSGETIDVDYRMHLRFEMNKLGLAANLELLDKSNDPNVTNHIRIYRRFAEADNDELFERFEVAKADLTDCNQVFQLLNRSLANTPSENAFLSILQHLLFIREDPFREHYYSLLDELVSQVVLQTDGVDIDPSLGILRLDVEGAINALLAAYKHDESSAKSDEMKKKLDQALQEKQEAEAQLENVRTKLKSYENGSISTTNTPSNPPPPPPGPGIPPPPPPPSGPGIPPPPPPPHGVPPPPGAPPPPPGAPPPPPGVSRAPAQTIAISLPFGIKEKPKYTPKLPMKKAYWDQINPKELKETSVWVNMAENELASDDLLESLTENFNTRPPKKVVMDGDSGTLGSNNTSNGTERTMARKVKPLRFLDPKSAQSLSILLGSMKLPYNELRRRIMCIDESLLTSSMIEQLLKALPEPNEISKIVALADEYDDLPEPEQFCCKVGTIKKLIPRLNSILFKMRFEERVTEIQPEIAAVTECLKQLRTSKHMLRVIEMVLLFGNYLNSGSRIAQSIGFHISFLPKLTGTKDISGKSTLLHFLLRAIETKFPDSVQGLPSDLSYLERASRFSEDGVKATIFEMKKSAKMLETDLRTYKSQEESDVFLITMTTFLTETKTKIDVLDTMFKRMQERFDDLATYFAFDSMKYNMESLLTDMNTFVTAYSQAAAEMAQQRAFEEKQKRLQEDRTNREAEQARLRVVGISGGTRKPTEQDGNVIDTLMESLKSGAAFGPGTGGVRRPRTRPQPTANNQSPTAVALRQNLIRQRSRRYANLPINLPVDV